MKVSLALPKNADVPFPEGFIRLNEMRGDSRRVDLIEVAFADEVESGEAVEVRIHGEGEFVVDGARIIGSFDM